MLRSTRSDGAGALEKKERERSLVKDRARELLLLLLPMLLPVPVLRRAHGQAAAAADRG